ncbi:aminotransferase class I/II-fold pyridoxal phosphate-dependent enzyme [Corynebacterium ulceribovis]|uniref:aminotransferase class I/II-fold pyridoxal phosphate-dependent enzyme n=1 Tax=Corynebacterium ulceribovis TaxID=487732 RepID=UPI00037D7237|nr:8-amino-7-oxononanoate synthase [Corynebacterium ulceribovis]
MSVGPTAPSADLTALAEASNARWREAGLERNAATFAAAQTAHTTLSSTDAPSREIELFSSSNYLGLAEHPQVTAAAIDAINSYGVGSGGSRLTTGTTCQHTALEHDLASIFGAPAAVFFTTGYQANLATITVLAELAASTNEPVTIFSDALNHASIIDGCRMASRTVASISTKIFPHRNYDVLAEQLASRGLGRALIISDGVFSMDGDVADLPKLQELARVHRAWLMIDDAHGVGTLGETGRGIAEHFGTDLPDILVGTASKALGVEGGFVLASAPVAHLLRNRARSYIFSTAAPAAVPAAVRAALRLVPSHVGRLQHNALRLRQLLYDVGVLPSAAGDGPIIVVPIGDETVAMTVAEQLRAAGFFIPAIRYPTVRRGEAILRITVMASHSEQQLSALAAELGRLLR